jgi:hypothetical protein
VTYTPKAGVSGQDTFTYKASDGTAESAPATVTISITHAPSCQNVARHTRTATAVSVPLTCSDADGDALTLSIAGAPTKGTLGSISGGSVTYTPNAGAFGTDTFTYKANDGTGDSANATATITISRAPSCSAVSRKTATGAPVAVPLSCTDPDGDALTLSIAGAPSKGTLGAISSGSVTYTPNAGASGADSFTYKANDGDGDSALATVSITITRPPACDPVTVSTPRGTAAAVTLACTDPDGDAITLEKAAGPSHGTLGAIDQGAKKVTYTPAAGYSGPDSFTYRATDGTATSPAATVSITVVAPPNTAPSCQAVTKTVVSATATQLQLACTDADGDALTLSKVAGPSHGTLGAIDQGTKKVTYTSAAGYSGPDSFSYKASDGTADSSTMKVTLTVTKKPDAWAGSTGGDTTPPSASITVAKQKLKAVLKKGLAVRATSNEHCSLSVQLIVDKATAKKLKLGKKATVIGRLTSSFSGSAQLKVKLTAKAKKALKKARSVKVSVRAVATDDAGNAAAPLLKRVTLKG